MSDALGIALPGQWLSPAGASFVSGASAISFATFALDGSTDAVEWIFPWPYSGVAISHVGFNISANAGTPPTYRYSLQGVGTTGNPDGTVKGGDTAKGTIALSATGFQYHALGTAYTPNRGEMLALVLDYSSGTIDTSNFSTVRTRSEALSRPGFPYVIHNAAGSRTRQVSSPVFAVRNSAHTVVYGSPIDAFSFTAVPTAGDIGLRFTLPSGWGATKKILMVRVGVRVITAGNTLTATLYDDAATPAVLQDFTFDMDALAPASGAHLFTELPFDEATLAELSFGTVYNLGFRVSGGTCNLDIMDVANAGDLNAFAGGTAFIGCTRAGNSDTFTAQTTKRYLAEISLADWTEPAGGGDVALVSYPLPMIQRQGVAAY